jgi:hypothetical protein
VLRLLTSVNGTFRTFGVMPVMSGMRAKADHGPILRQFH